jgi:hypothetical protein
MSFRWISIVIFLSVAAADNQLLIAEADLKQYDGTDPTEPIYLAINGTIFDVSASPSFYGPGGHYRKAASQQCLMGTVLIIVD